MKEVWTMAKNSSANEGRAHPEPVDREYQSTTWIPCGWATLLRLGVVLLAPLILAACANASTEAAGGDDLSLQISSPSDGASVSEPFTIEVEASVPLDDPDTGEHHVHLCFDGQSCDQEYQLVYGNTFEISGLSAGEHTIEASLRNADHSAAGPTDSITVTITSGGMHESSSPSDSQSGY
jgi:hypothetical protein